MTTFVVRLHGSSYANPDGSSRQAYLAECRKGDKLTLRAEPDNPHDRNAVAVLDARGRQLGYLPSDARDASSLRRGEDVTAHVERLIGGTKWWHRLFWMERHYGLLIRLDKAPVDWTAHNVHRNIAQPVDAMVREALAYEKTGAAAREVIARYEAALAAVVELNRSNPVAAAHRHEAAPINRLTMLLVKEKRADDARRVYDLWLSVVDPVGLRKSDKDPLEKRMARLLSKRNPT